MRNRLNPLNTKHLLILFGMLIVLGISIQFAAAYILDLVLNLMPDVRASYETTLNELLTDDFRTMTMVILFSPVLEEIVFRLLILRLGKKYIPFWIMNIIQALLFGIYHGNWVQGVYAFLLGMVLGYVLEATDVLISSIIVHMSINICGVMMQDIPLFQTGTSPLIPVIAVLSMLIGGAILISFSQPERADGI